MKIIFNSDKLMHIRLINSRLIRHYDGQIERFNEFIKYAYRFVTNRRAVLLCTLCYKPHKQTTHSIVLKDIHLSNPRPETRVQGIEKVLTT